MSHFSVMVQLGKLKDFEGENDERLQSALAPFDENTDVPEYEKECYCKRHKVNVAIMEEQAKKFGKIDDLRNEFRDLPASRDLQDKQNALWNAMETTNDKETRKRLRDDIASLEKEQDAAWKKFIKADERDALEKKRRPQLEKKLKPDADCDECKGTGIAKTTYNPDSKWDWWQVGGRWSNYFGDGVDWASGKQVKELLKKDEDDLVPFAILTKDGKWNEKGRMGWWAMVADEKEDWGDQAKAIIESFDDDDLVVAVDCHI